MRQMPCDQCGRTLALDEAGMGMCPSCGRAATLPTQALGAMLPAAAGDDAATRPVPPMAGGLLDASRGSRREPSVLDQAAPPSAAPPSSLDALTAPAAPYLAEASPARPHVAADATVARAAAPPLDPTAPLPSGIAAGGEAAAAAGAGKSARRGVVSAVGLLLVLILGVVGVILAANAHLLSGVLGSGPTTVGTVTPVATTGGPPTPPAGFRTFTAADGSYMLAVPNTWTSFHQLAGKADLTVLADPTTKANFNIEAIAGLDDPVTLDVQFIAGLGPAMAGKTGTSSVEGQTAPDQTAVAGVLWTRVAADVTVSAGGQMTVWHVVTLAAQHGGKTLLIAYFAPAVSFDALDDVAFQPMLNSLLLVAPQP
jgi:hypothetical protein